jgi:hypothetical protein
LPPINANSPIRQAQEKGVASGVTLKGIVSSLGDNSFVLADDGSCIKVQKYVSSSSSGGDGGDRGVLFAPGASYQEGDYVQVEGNIVQQGDGYVLSATTEPFPLEETKPIVPAPLEATSADIFAIEDDITAHLTEDNSYHYIPNPWGYHLSSLFAYLNPEAPYGGFFLLPGSDYLRFQIEFEQNAFVSSSGCYYDATLYFTEMGLRCFVAGIANATEVYPTYQVSAIKPLNDAHPVGDYFSLKGVVLGAFFHYFLLDDGAERLLIDNNWGKESPEVPVTGNVVQVSGCFTRSDNLLTDYILICDHYALLREKIAVNTTSTDLSISSFETLAHAWAKNDNPDRRVSIRYTIHNLKVFFKPESYQLSCTMTGSDDGTGNPIHVLLDNATGVHNIGETILSAEGYLIGYDGAGFDFFLTRYNGVGPESGFTDVEGFNAMGVGADCSLDLVVMGFWTDYTLLMARDATGTILINWNKYRPVVDEALLKRGNYVHVEGTKYASGLSSSLTLPDGVYLSLKTITLKTETAPEIDLSWTPGRTLNSRAELYALPNTLEPVVSLFKNVTLVPDERYFGYFSVENNENIEFQINADIYDFSAISASLKYAVADVSGVIVTYPSASHCAVILLTGVDIKETHTDIDVEITVVDSINVTSFTTPDGGLALYFDAFQSVTPNYPFIQQVHPALVYYSDSACTVTIADLPFSFYLVNSNHYSLDANPTAYKNYVKDGYYDVDFYAKITFLAGEGNQSYRVKNATHVVIHVPVQS